MADFNSVAEIEQAIQAAKTAEDIGDIFREVFAYGSRGFSASSTVAVDALYTALERLCNKEGTPSAIELRDLSSTLSVANQHTYNIREEVSANPAFKILVEATSGIDPKAIKQEAEDTGAAIWDRLATTVEFANKIGERKQEIESLYAKLDTSEFRDSVYKLSKSIYCALREEKYPVYMSNVEAIIKEDIDGTLDIEKCDNDIRPAVRRFLEIRDKFYNEAGETWKLYQNSRKAYKNASEAFHAESETVLEQFRNALIEQSGISEAEAQEWAQNNVYIDKNVGSVCIAFLVI